MTAGGLLVAQVWDDLVPGHLPHRYGDESVIVARRLLHNGGPVEQPTVALHELQAAATIAPGRLGRISRRITDPWDWRRFLGLVAAEMDEHRMGLIHGHFGTTAARLLPVAAASGRPLVASFYGVDASAVLREPRWRHRYQELFAGAALLVVLCDAVADRLMAAGAPSDKVAVWNMPAGIERYAFRERQRVEAVRFLVAARFVAKKGYFVLLDAFERYLHSGRDATLTMIGYGPLASAIREAAEQRGVWDRCELIDTALSADFHETFDRAMSNADVFVMPSITAPDGDDEGGPALTMVCAQASGLPVVCTPFPGAERSLVDGVTGLYCAEADPVSLMERMIELADDLPLAARLGIAGSELVRREFSARGQTDKMLLLYERVAAAVAS